MLESRKSRGRIATLALSAIVGASLAAAALAQNAGAPSTTPEVPAVAKPAEASTFSSAETSAAPASQSAEKAAAPAKCLEAAVNPVTGFAVCVNPRGAPVEAPPPPTQPCKPRAHDNETGTVYEHWSAC